MSFSREALYTPCYSGTGDLLPVPPPVLTPKSGFLHVKIGACCSQTTPPA